MLRSRKAIATIALAAAVAVVAPPVVAPAPAAASPAGFVLPAPTGKHEVGRDVLHLVDRERRDQWVPERDRELMVSMYYPAASRKGRAAGYLTATEARLFLEMQGAAGAVDADRLSATRGTARTGAEPRRGRFPLVVLSPGFTLHRHTLTALAEQLASRGYVVAAIDHAYESAGSLFPGGRTLTCTACEVLDGATLEESARLPLGRAGDVGLVLDRLGGWRHARMIDFTRIGMAGHSIGGNAAAATMAADRRVRAGINMDGTFVSPVAEGLDRPFLMLGTPPHAPGGRDYTWDRDYQKLGGWKRWLTVTGTGHLDFSDVAVIADQAGLADPESPLPGDRTTAIVRTYVVAFFDRHLRGVAQPLLDGPSAAYPEVMFHRP
ncbi:lipase [Actinoplanes sp. NPDC023714]|uniref:alpha/beta hydrolase family protein n=1 Tax=Actinoplanes sp. NPDC023714 TaxID=3154322 RepID=UPI00340C2BD8